MPEQAESAAERAYREIRDDILDGTHSPGAMLGEAPLAAVLGVSRTPVRAALVRLQDEGWITIYPKRGALVRGLGEREIAQLADARFVLETTAVDRADEELRQLLVRSQTSLIVQQREAFACGDVRRFVSLTLRFHRGFVEAGGNAVLLELYDRLRDRHRFVLFAAGARLLERCEEIIDEHTALVDSLANGDVARFASVLRGHVAEVFPDGAPEYGRTTPALRSEGISG